jgi:protein phosphatase 1D
MSGTTASVAFIRKGKIYIGHVGDSSIVLGYQDEVLCEGRPLTRDHKPESAEDTARIVQSGGKVVRMAGVPKVVLNRPRIQFGYRGPVGISAH